jgi:hypothetical protein
MKKIQMTEANIKTTIGLIIILAFTVLIYTGLRKQNRLVVHGKLAVGMVIGEARTYRGGLELEYKFRVGKETYTKVGSAIDLYVIAGRDFQGKTFPVLYDPEHPNNNHILVSPKDFDSFNMKFPDSLNWVKNYVR